MTLRITPWPKKIAVVVVGKEAFCSLCGLLVAHEPSSGPKRTRIWVPVEHDAPECGGPCLAGGVDRATYHLHPRAHRIDCARCDADLILW